MTAKQMAQRIPERAPTMTTQQAASEIGLSPATLASWRSQGLGPAYIKLSATRVSYRSEEVFRWIEENTRHGNSSKERKLALPREGKRPRVHGRHRLGGHKTKSERRDENRIRGTAEGSGRQRVGASASDQTIH